MKGTGAEAWWAGRRTRVEKSDAGDVGAEEVDFVAVEVPAGAVTVLGGSGVGGTCEDPGVPERTPSIEGVGDGPCRSECGLM